MLAELVRKTRSYRRFYEDEPIGEEALRELVDLARLSASGGNGRFYELGEASVST